MAHLHSSNISKGRRIAGYVLSIIPSILFVASGIMKIIGNPNTVENMTKIHLEDSLLAVGIIELICVILYWIPKTVNIGFFLMCSYAGGMIAGEIIMGEFPLTGVVTATLIYVGTMLRKKELSGLGI